MDISTTVKEIISEIACIPVSSIESTSTLESLDMGSLDVAEVIVELEDVFAIDISDSAFDEWETVGNIIEHMEKHAS